MTDSSSTLKALEMAVRGYSNAQLVLGMHYLNGTGGLEQNTFKGVEFLFKAVNQTSSQAKMELATLYRYGFVGDDGVEVEKDTSTAHKLYMQCSESGIAEADKYIGDLYKYDDDFRIISCLKPEQNDVMAVCHYESAANRGSMEAQYIMGMMLGSENNPQRNDKKAVSYLKMAAEQGHESAKQELKNNANQSSDIRPR